MKKLELPEAVPRNLQRTKCAVKHDGLGWTVGSAYEWQDLRLGVRCNDLAVLPRLESFLPKGAKKSEVKEVEVLISLRVGQAAQRRGQTNYHLVYHAWDRVARTMDLDEALEAARNLLAERCAIHCVESFYVKGSLWNSPSGPVACHGEFSELAMALNSSGPLAGYIEFTTRDNGSGLDSLRGILLANESFTEVTELSAGQAAVWALNRNLAPAFLADAGRCLHRLGSYFSKAPVWGVPTDISRSDLLELLSTKVAVPQNA